MSTRPTTGELATEVARLATGQQQAAQHRAKRLGLQVGAGGLSDGFGGGVGALGCDAALLDGEVRDVAGGVDIVEAAHESVGVNRDEAVDRLRYAVEAQAVQPRQRDDAVGVDLAVGHESQFAVDEVGRIRRRHELDPAFVEQFSHGLAAGVSEEFQWRFLGRDERELDSVDLVGGERVPRS